MFAKILELAGLIPPCLVFSYKMGEEGKFSGLPNSQLVSQLCVNNSLNQITRSMENLLFPSVEEAMLKAVSVTPVPLCRLATLLAQGLSFL